MFKRGRCARKNIAQLSNVHHFEHHRFATQFQAWLFMVGLNLLSYASMVTHATMLHLITPRLMHLSPFTICSWKNPQQFDEEIDVTIFINWPFLWGRGIFWGKWRVCHRDATSVNRFYILYINLEERRIEHKASIIEFNKLNGLFNTFTIHNFWRIGTFTFRIICRSDFYIMY